MLNFEGSPMFAVNSLGAVNRDVKVKKARSLLWLPLRWLQTFRTCLHERLLWVGFPWVGDLFHGPVGEVTSAPNASDDLQQAVLLKAVRALSQAWLLLFVSWREGGLERADFFGALKCLNGLAKMHALNRTHEVSPFLASYYPFLNHFLEPAAGLFNHQIPSDSHFLAFFSLLIPKQQSVSASTNGFHEASTSWATKRSWPLAAWDAFPGRSEMFGASFDLGWMFSDGVRSLGTSWEEEDVGGHGGRKHEAGERVGVLDRKEVSGTFLVFPCLLRCF